MSDGHLELDAAANDPTLLAAESEGRPAFVVDGDGDVVWAGDAAFRLIGADSLDDATRRALSRMARSGSGGLLRLRLGDRPARFRARAIRLDGEGAMLALEGLSPAVDATPAPIPARDVAAEEGVAGTDDPKVRAGGEEARTFEAAAAREDVSGNDAPAFPDLADELADDLPPDPRRMLRPATAPVADSGPAPAPEVAENAGSSGEGGETPDENAAILHGEGPFPGSVDPFPGEAEEAYDAHETGDAHRAESASGVGDPSGDDAGVAANAPAPFEPFRFAFEFDGQSRLTYLSPEMRRGVGPGADAAIGRDWDGLAADLGLDPTGAVSAALARRGSWSDLEVSWPLGDGRRAPITLSALPMFDRGRSFVGFRGLGRSVGRPADQASRASEPIPAVHGEGDQLDAAAGNEVAAAEAGHGPAEHGTVENGPTDAEPAERQEPPVLFEVKPEPPSFSGNVVPLRETPPPSPRLPALSSSEESAFDEIARRLQGLSRREDDGGPDGGISRTILDEDTLSAAAEAAARIVDLEDSQRALPFAAGADELLRLVDRMPVGALVLRGGDVAHANRAALDLLGCREFDDLSGRGSDTLFAEALPQDRDAPPGVMRLISANGDEVEVEARLTTVAWGGAPATLVTLRRPDASLAAARETEQRERELSAALDVASDGVMTLDGAGRILSVNRGAETLFGFEGQEVIGSLFTLTLAPESRKAAFDCLDGLKTGEAQPNDGVEVLGLSRQGGALPLLMTIGRIAPDAAGRYCAVLRDIGPWKRAEEELIAARRQAERANAQKSEFLAKVGHEIRTPLNAIIGFAEVMMEERLGPVGSPRYKDYLKDIHASGGHLVKMVDDLLDISRIETGKLKLDFGPVDLNEIASQAAALLQTQANRDHVIIRTSLARGLPPVLADRRSIRQIMTNLAANAVKLSRPGGQVIVATALTDGGQAVFRVRDAGAGMSKQEIARAFEPFRPLAVADNDTGFGLGLPLTRALAEANEAALALQSEVGRGTLAEVTFPASRVLAG